MTEARLLAPPGPGRRLRVMGILNVTPDSFSDGGLWSDTESAVAQGLALRAGGADIVDVGGESTRPGAARVAPEIELGRVIPVIRELSGAGVLCSVDTTRASVAQAAVEVGAVLINDVSGGLADPDMASVAADTGAPWLLMHWRAHSLTMTDHAHYTDVVTDVRAELLRQVDVALAAGVLPGALILDPGLGFAKRSEHNWELLRRLTELLGLGFPVLIGASRKRFLPQTGRPIGSAEDLTARDTMTAAITALVAGQGAWGVRVHNAELNVRAAEVVAAIGPNPVDQSTGVFG